LRSNYKERSDWFSLDMTRKSPKILIIEDEKILAEMYRDKFNQAGFKTEVAFTAEEGLRFLKKKKADLILLDILLPRENGIQFLKRIQKYPKISRIPVVAFSNYDDPRAKNEAFNLGIKEYLIKTAYTSKEIIKKIRNILVS